MLFFRSCFYSKSLTRHSNSRYLKKICAPLQVQICKVQIYLKKKKESGKRALSWVSLKGSLTLEAALCFPLMIFFCVTLLMPMVMMDRQRQIQAVAEAVGEEISQYAYVAYLYENGNENEGDVSRAENGTDDRILKKATAVYAAAAVKEKIPEKWVQDLDFYGTRITEDEKIQIVMHYKMPLPFSVFGINSIPVKTVCSRRLWTGADGGRGRKNAQIGEKEEVMVYIGKSSTRYHRQRNCHYLFHDLKQVRTEDLSGLRSQEGKKYKPCASCKSSGNSGYVYVLPYGESYHTREDCTSLSAYVQEVPLDQAEYLGACSYCSQ